VELDPEAKDPLTMRAKVLASAALETLESAKQAKPGAKAAAATPARKK
jgi:hypothetical protein